MSLRTGTELICLSMLFNKVTGFFGLLAVLTGFRLSAFQFSMYSYSLVALIILTFLMPHIRKQSPFQNLALAWFYLLDTVINTAFTAAFAVTWLLAVSADTNNTDIPSSAPGSSTIVDTSGFANTSTGAVTGTQDQEAVSNPTLKHAVGIEETLPSILVVVALTLVRVYFILVVMAYARQVLRNHIYSSSSTKLHLHTDGAADSPVGNPFADGTPEGEGWRGKLGRAMVKVGESYWLGGQADDAWVRGLDNKFNATKSLKALTPAGPPGTVERERRARSGTGPPKPSANLGAILKV